MANRVVQVALGAALVALLFSPPHAITQSGSALSPRRVFAGRYPLLAHLAGTGGDVHLVAQVSPQGSVRSVRVESGVGLLIEPARTMLSR